MSEIREELRYSEEHEWASPPAAQGRVVRIGITDHAQSQLGDIVFVELPSVGAAVYAGESIGAIESVKTVSELYSPVTGKVVRVNDGLLDHPERVNESPYEEGWIAEVELDAEADEALGGLLTAQQYGELTK
ncbi:glycine cleavage system protein GcvH [Cohnella nanjingensis]|uniref:Glycine cleavage system H protein n=1 Tax=Cohnella nanjingensis TaxID=1387779 RepID=A0A7X0RTE4_9BACL|nr:glycine cleavage system protein GcvH [Cohnella nanjingensis]MBB6673349.1 glycine cleavage system protein GcvH [Cohnella nanjingensis]